MPAPPPAAASQDERARRVEQVLRRLSELPTLPAVATRLLKLSADEAADSGEVVRLIESRPGALHRDRPAAQPPRPHGPEPAGEHRAGRALAGLPRRPRRGPRRGRAEHAAGPGQRRGRRARLPRLLDARHRGRRGLGAARRRLPRRRRRARRRLPPRAAPRHRQAGAAGRPARGLRTRGAGGEAARPGDGRRGAARARARPPDGRPPARDAVGPARCARRLHLAARHVAAGDARGRPRVGRSPGHRRGCAGPDPPPRRLGQPRRSAGARGDAAGAGPHGRGRRRGARRARSRGGRPRGGTRRLGRGRRRPDAALRRARSAAPTPTCWR